MSLSEISSILTQETLPETLDEGLDESLSDTSPAISEFLTDNKRLPKIITLPYNNDIYINNIYTHNNIVLNNNNNLIKGDLLIYLDSYRGDGTFIYTEKGFEHILQDDSGYSFIIPKILNYSLNNDFELKEIVDIYKKWVNIIVYPLNENNSPKIDTKTNKLE